jgi:general secretion pathway protein J
MSRRELRNAGFTLIEVLVAVALFVLLSALAYGGYNASVKQAQIAREGMDRLKQLQTAIRLITQDFEELAPRPVRDVLGEARVPALLADPRAQNLVTLTRGGWPNPAGLPRSTLQRVTYVLEDGKLRRDYLNVLDATLSNEPVKRELLDHVREVRIRYLDIQKQWQDQWPPLNAPPQTVTRYRPVAVEVTIELEDLGEIQRLIEVDG